MQPAKEYDPERTGTVFFPEWENHNLSNSL
jgi:hypothetical protein